MKIEIISKTVHYCTLRGIEKVIWKNPEERKKEILTRSRKREKDREREREKKKKI